MKEDKIIIKGARVHNLKNVNLELPKNKLITFTGVSGSGKSSLAFDTIFAEGQRRYIESLSPYARQFLGQMDKPDVDNIEGLSPAISISQKALSHNPRSTVATLTEIYDYLRVLFARIGKPYCPVCGQEIKRLTIDEMFNLVTKNAKELKSDCLTILSPVIRGRKGEYYQLLYDFLQKGFTEVRVDGKPHSLHNKIVLSRYKSHNIDIVIDKVMPTDESRLFEALENAIDYSKGLVTVIFDVEAFNMGRTDLPRRSVLQKFEKNVHLHGQQKAETELLLSSRLSCPNDGFAFSEIEPRLFSFNSPYGACEACHGLGRESLFSDEPCVVCHGKRLKPEALSVKISAGIETSPQKGGYGKNIYEIVSLTIEDCYEFFVRLEDKLTEKEKFLSRGLTKEIISRLGFLLEVGLDYIALSREASTLSGGEAQRMRLASQIGSMLSNTLYVLDEPTIGLHEQDTEKLLRTLKGLRDLNNTIIIVEHEERMIKESNYLVDLGPGAGVEGGEIMAAGETEKLIKDRKNKSLTLDYLRKDRQIEIPPRRTKITEKLKLIGARMNNLKNIDVEFPLRKLVCVTGVSGSGKSSLLETLYKNAVRLIYRIPEPLENTSKLLGTEYIRRIVEISQSPIGRTPRSNPATYTGIWTPIRDFYASTEDARARGYGKSRFSFNVKGGRCEACQGAGYNLVEMHFLPPVLVQCEVCKGKRFNKETLGVKYEGKNIADILDMTVDEALDFFKDIYPVAEKLKVLEDIGLGYIKLGQSATTLSGGEAQRIKLSKELSEHATKTVYILDEPTVGLHYHDVELLIEILQKLIERQNTVILIEHNLELIKVCDHIIDLGPEGGDKGGRVIATGRPEEIAKNKNSYTGQYLRKIL
jgi:excinuclease ABC subunit A